MSQIKSDRGDVYIIKEIYDSENAHETFGEELEKGLELESYLIIIEPNRLGDETARWISVGNCLHKTAVISGLGAILTGLSWGEFPYVYGTFCASSLICTSLYTVSWQFDPCVKYQVCTDPVVLSKLPFAFLTSTSPVVLIRKNDNRRKILHVSITVIAAAFSAYRLYSLFNK